MNKLFWAVISVALSAIAMHQVFNTTTFLKPIVEQCTTQPLTELSHSFLKTGVGPVDGFLCFITPFFVAVTQENFYFGISSYFFVSGPFLAGFLFSGFEGLKAHSFFAVLLVPVTFLVGQLISISAAFPLIFVTAYFLFIAGPWPPTVFDPPAQVGAGSTCTLLFCGLVLVASIMVIPYCPQEYSDLTIAIFQFIPGIGFLLLPFVFGEKKPLPRAHENKWVTSTYTFTRALLGVFHVASLFFLFASGLAPSFFSIDRASPASTALLLFYDGLWLSASLALLVLSKSGLSGFLQFLIRSVVFGPGVTFLEYAHKWELETPVGAFKVAL